MPEPREEAAGEAQEASQGRLQSLDAFRGLAVLGMLLVNEKAFGPATPRQLTHAGWDESVHLADMVFPWFLLIVGVAIPFAASRRGRDVRPAAYYLGVLRRAVVLVLLGCLINSSYAKRPAFDFGVLQLIGCAYLVGALLYGLPMRARLGAAAGLLLAHWALVRFLPIPDVGAGVFTKTQNAIVHLNQTYLRQYDLDGILNVVTTAALVLIGTTVGDWLRSASSGPRKVKMLTLAGVGLVLGGWLWHLDIPFNKPLWTAPYVVFAAGWGTGLLACCYWVIDLRERRRWAFPLVVAGRNAIFAFAAPIMTNLYILREWHWGGPAAVSPTVEEAIKAALFAHLGRVPGGFAYTFGYISLWWLVLYWMYRRRIFLRV
jgi:predicted acyltransferase